MSRFIVNAALIITLCSLSMACVSSWSQEFNIYLDNDTSQDLYDARVVTDAGQSLINWPSEDYVLKAKKSVNTHGIAIRSIPKEVRVRWKNEPKGSWVERRIAIRDTLGRRFDGITFVSILENGSLALSWVKEDRTECGGYIFDAYYYRAKPIIEKNFNHWKASYLKQKEAAGLTVDVNASYEKGGYPDWLDERKFQCNFRFYRKI